MFYLIKFIKKKFYELNCNRMSIDIELDPVKLSKLYMIKIRKLRLELGLCPSLNEFILNLTETNIQEDKLISKKIFLDYIHTYFETIIDRINYEIDKKYCVELDTTHELYYVANENKDIV